MDGITANLISLETGSSARFIQIELDSIITLNNSLLEDMKVSIANWFTSIVILNNLIAKNITSSQFIIDCYYCESVTFKNISMSSWSSIGVAGMINFKKAIAENIEDSYFIDSQLITIIFDNSVLKSFTGNTLNGMYKGLQFIRNSNGTVSNSIITGMIQKVKFHFILFSHFLHKVQAALQFISRISLVMVQELVTYFNKFYRYYWFECEYYKHDIFKQQCIQWRSNLNLLQLSSTLLKSNIRLRV